MIYSMTGYGSAHTAADGVSYAIELRSLNNRHYKSTIKMPEGYAALEADIDGLLRKRINRGSVAYSLRVRDNSPAAAPNVNAAVMNEYLKSLRGLDGIDSSRIDPASLLLLPGVCDPGELDEAILAKRGEVIKKLTLTAIEELMDMRRREGEALLAHLTELCGDVRTNLAQIAERSPTVVGEYRVKLEARVARLLSESRLELEKDALTREVAVFADRCDISEEITRLTSHLDQFARMCDEDDAPGRRLDFLGQEMLREANTIGSKANDSQIARHIVEIKAAIERIKEQVQNVE